MRGLEMLVVMYNTPETLYLYHTVGNFCGSIFCGLGNSDNFVDLYFCGVLIL